MLLPILSTAQTPPWLPPLPSFHFSTCLLRTSVVLDVVLSSGGNQMLTNTGTTKNLQSRKGVNKPWLTAMADAWDSLTHCQHDSNCQFLPTEPGVASGSPFQYDPSQSSYERVRPQNELNATSTTPVQVGMKKTGKKESSGRFKENFTEEAPFETLKNE